MNLRLWRRGAVVLGLALSLCATAGCGDDDDDNNDVAPECERDRDCDPGEVCEDNACVPEVDVPEPEPEPEPVPECERDSDCDDDEVCEDDECVPDEEPPECERDRDCDRDEVCEDGVCVEAPPECVRDRDCDDDEVCERGECVPGDNPPECERDEDCDDGEVCREGECVEDDFPGQTDIALEAPELTLEAFTVAVDATASMVAVGQAVTVSARQFHGTPEGELALAWAFEGDPQVEAEAEDAPEQTLTFAEPGRFLIRLTATDEADDTFSTGALVVVLDGEGAFTVGDADGDGDVDGDDVELAASRLEAGAVLEPAQFVRADVDLDGEISERDVDLILNAADAGALAPRDLDPTRGSFGRKVNLIHPALLDPGVEVRILFEGAAAQIPVRTLPGYATFIVPVELQTAALTTLSVEVDGEIADQFEFEILDAPAASEVPGEKVIEALNGLDNVVRALPEITDEMLQALEADRDERAAVIGTLQFASNSLTLQREAFANAFAMMEDDGKATFEQIALANGIDDVLADLSEVREDLRILALQDSSFFNVGAENSQRLIDIICTIQSILDISDQIANINSIASDVIGFVDFFPINRLPGVGAVISFLSNVSKIVGIITDALAFIGRFVPTFGDLEAVAAPAALVLGQSSEVSATIQLKVLANLCDQIGGDLVNDLIDGLNEKLTLTLASNIPVIGGLFEQEDFRAEDLGFVAGLIFDAVSFLAGAILDAIGVEDVLNGLLEKLCDFIGGADPVLQIEPEVDFSCGGAGTTFTCIEACLGSVTATATKDICGEDKQDTVGITCSCESNCDEEGARTCDGQTVVECQEVATDCLQLRDIEECVDPEECINGACVDPNACNVGTCPNGCCDAQDNCVEFADQSIAACGTGGNACFACSGDDPVCNNGVCEEQGGGQCGCNTDGVTFVPIEGCDDFGDERECSGFHSVFCFNDDADPNDPLCQFSPESDEAFESTEFDDGTQYTAFGCTIEIQCP